MLLILHDLSGLGQVMSAVLWQCYDYVEYSSLIPRLAVEYLPRFGLKLYSPQPVYPEDI